MLRNTASQVVDCQMTTIADGSPFTGTVTVSVKLNTGSLAAGGGTVSHKGGGLHTYLPTQAETNGVLLSYQFEGDGAITKTVIFDTSIEDFIGARTTAADAAFAALPAGVRTELTTELGRIDVATSTRLAAGSYTAPLSAAGIRAAVGLASANLDTQLGTLSTPAQVLTQVNAALDAVIADSIPADGSRPTIRQALYILVQFMLERSVSGTTCTVKKPDGSATLLTLTLNDPALPTSVTRAS
jgi:hypothetical protein